jgi:oligopeptidase B
MNMNAPKANKIVKELTTNGHTRIDNYFWLNDRDNPEVIQYLNNENDYTESVMADYSDLKENLFQEIVARIKQTDESVPYKDNGYFYYTRFEEKLEYPIYCRRKDSMTNSEEVILNVNEVAKGHEYCQVSGLDISKDNKFMAYGVDTVSRRMYTIYFKNLETGELFDIAIPNATGSVAWANDNNTVFYTTKDSQTLRADKIFKHKLGTELSQDQLIYEETDDIYGTAVYKTKSDDYLMIICYSKTSDEYRFLSANEPDGVFKLIQPREKDLEYNVDQYLNKFYIVTNYNARNFRLMETEIANPSKENWKELIAHRPDVFLQNIEVFSKYLVLSERKNGLINLRVIEWSSQNDYYLNFGEEAYTAGIGINTDFESELLRYSYSSLTTPGSVYDYNMTTHEKTLKKQQVVVGNFKSTDYVSKRLYVKARDGENVPVSLVYKKGLNIKAKNPLLLYGYGSYGISIDASFSSTRLSLLDRGFIYVIAHIRGGQEMGRQWYENGKMLNKKNTFTDFIDCAEYLIENEYTSPEKLFAMGGSAGGLLMGAVMNMRPDLFKGIVAVVPFVDVVTTMLDESIPLTTGEYDEWGNPNESIYYNYMVSYSPYDNVQAVNYPAMLVMTGLHDSQVQYWEPAKWVAKLRDMKTDNNLLLLNTNMKSGHGGASGRFEIYRDNALEYAFILKLLDIHK